MMAPAAIEPALRGIHGPAPEHEISGPQRRSLIAARSPRFATTRRRKHTSGGDSGRTALRQMRQGQPVLALHLVQP
jgi:hypothetical protein